ncbi:MAG: helix-turn-helix transcriptional regulator [Desulfobacteraceae bacterium]|nr:helix-turn-helix transcriptional regulator [Desulfobacteraceae bacterium]
MDNKNGIPHINVDYFEDLTGTIKPSPAENIEEIGDRIQSIRREKGLSLPELSNLTGFDVEMLSNIESNKIQPQLGALIKLSKALDSAFGRIVSGQADKIYSITRKGEQHIISRSTSDQGDKQVYTYMSLAPDVKGRHMEALMVRLDENPDKEMSVHEGEEFIYVLNGTATCVIGADSFELNSGDSVYYLSTTPHSISAKKGSASILAVLYEG